MATKRPTFEKRQRERDKQAKAAAKRERRQSGSAAAETPEETPEANLVRDVDVPSVLARVDELHRRFEEGSIAFDDFDEQKRALLASLPVD